MIGSLSGCVPHWIITSTTSPWASNPLTLEIPWTDLDELMGSKGFSECAYRSTTNYPSLSWTFAEPTENVSMELVHAPGVLVKPDGSFECFKRPDVRESTSWEAGTYQLYIYGEGDTISRNRATVQLLNIDQALASANHQLKGIRHLDRSGWINS